MMDNSRWSSDLPLPESLTDTTCRLHQVLVPIGTGTKFTELWAVSNRRERHRFAEEVATGAMDLTDDLPFAVVVGLMLFVIPHRA